GAIGPLPSQLFVVGAGAVGFWLLVHRMAVGRTLRAIGFSADGTRYAGVRVGRRLAAVYLLSGLCAGVAALLYVSRLGQAKADAGTGFELMAITAGGRRGAGEFWGGGGG